MEYFKLDVEDVLRELKTDLNNGLRQESADKLLLEVGFNEIPKTTSWLDNLKTILAPLFNWLILIYLIGALILYFASLAQGKTNMNMIYSTLGIVGINCFVAIFQQARANKKLSALQELSAPMSTVVRDGMKVEMYSREIVVGDLLDLKLGDKIPADARIVYSSNLQTDEASLTGESEPVKKNKGKKLVAKDISIGDRVNMVFFGTYVTAGNGSAIVTATGGNTEIGKISQGLSDAGSGEIPIQKKMNNFGKYLGLIVAVFWVFVMIILQLKDGHVDVVKSLNSAMDIMPINIPLLTTIVMITGVLDMAQHGVIVRNLAAVDSLGRVSVVCSDKTGTLTKSQMCVENVWVNNQVFKVTGNGYEPVGDVCLLDSKGDKCDPVLDIKSYPHLKKLLIAGKLNNNSELKIIHKDIDGKNIPTWNVIGNPTEGALVSLFYKLLKEDEFEGGEQLVEFPFSSSLKRMSKVYQQDESITSYTKGATNFIIPLCSTIIYKNKIQNFTKKIQENVMDEVNQFANQGYRVLSLAYKDLDEEPKEEDDAREKCESGLTYVGFVTILDPPREDVYDAITDCNDAGVDVIMITGDSPNTAKAIGKQIAIIKSEDELAIKGSEIADIIDTPDFNKVKVFARVSPSNKEEIIAKYQSQGKVVAMTGDGVNDALALNMADAGMAMGIQGTDVAKEAADMVISDDAFSSIIKGIHRGRGIFANIRSVIFFYIVINLFEGLVQFAIAVLGNKPYFLNPEFNWQWIWLSMTIHIFPGMILTFDKISDDVMKEAPRDSQEILTKDVMVMMLGYGALLTIAMVLVYNLVISGTYPVFDDNWNFKIWGEHFLYTDENIFNPDLYDVDNLAIVKETGTTDLRIQGKTLTMLMVVLMFSESFVAMQIRRPNKSFLRMLKEDKNPMMVLLLGILFFLFIAIMYIPGLQVGLAKNLGFNTMFMFLNLLDWIVCFSIAMITIVGFEGIKYFLRENPTLIDEISAKIQDKVKTKPTEELINKEIKDLESLLKTKRDLLDQIKSE